MSIPLSKDNETLRDEIAIVAMKELVKYEYVVDGFTVKDNIAKVARTSYEIADAMLEARKR